MGGIYKRGRKLWRWFLDGDGKRVFQPCNLNVGDEARAKKVLAEIERRIEAEKRTGKEKKIHAPERCPECSGVVEKEGPKVFCVNPECPAQFREKLQWFVGRGQMDIDGLGEKRTGGDCPGLAGPLDAQRVQRRRRLIVPNLDARHI